METGEIYNTQVLAQKEKAHMYLDRQGRLKEPHHTIPTEPRVMGRGTGVENRESRIPITPTGKQPERVSTGSKKYYTVPTEPRVLGQSAGVESQMRKVPTTPTGKLPQAGNITPSPSPKYNRKASEGEI